MMCNLESLRIYNTFVQAHDAYKKIVEMALVVFAPLEQRMKKDFGQTLKDFLDESFYNKVVVPVKLDLLNFDKLRDIVEGYNREYRKKTSSRVIQHNVPENIYIGELNTEGQRHGYGKITYISKDTYEGQWEFDKPHG